MSETPSFVNIRKNALHFPSLPQPMRILTGLGIAEIIVGTLLLLFKDVAFPSIVAGMYQNKLVTLPLPFLFLGTLLLVTGWTYLLAGAVQSHRWIALAAFALFSLCCNGSIRDLEAWPLGLICWLALGGYFTVRATVLRDRAPHIVVDVAVFGLLTLAIEIAPIVVYLVAGDILRLLAYSLDISGQVLFLLPFLIPLLVIAGVDLAEISTEAGGWLTDHLLAHVDNRFAVAGLLAFAGVKIAVQLASVNFTWFLPLVSLPTAAGLVAVFFGLRFLLRRSGLAPEPEREQPDATAGDEREQEPDGDKREEDAAEEEASPSLGLLLILAYGLFIAFIGATSAMSFLPVKPGSADQGAQFPIQATWSLGGIVSMVVATVWMAIAYRRHQRFPVSLVVVLLFGLWVCVSVGNPVGLVRSPEAGKSTIDPLVRLPQLDVAISLVCAVALVALARSGRHTKETLGFIGAALVGISLLGAISTLYDQQLAVTDLVTLAQVALVLGLIAFGLVRTLRRRETKRLGRIVSIAGLFIITAISVGVVALVVGSLTHVLPPSVKLPTDATTVIVFSIALCWDLLMSGGRFTNQHGARLPRHGRVLLYVGYVALVAAALLWMKSLRNMPEEIFNESILPSFGLLTLGVVVMLYLWVLATRKIWPDPAPGSVEEGATPEEPAAPGQPDLDAAPAT